MAATRMVKHMTKLSASIEGCDIATQGHSAHDPTSGDSCEVKDKNLNYFRLSVGCY